MGEVVNFSRAYMHVHRTPSRMYLELVNKATTFTWLTETGIERGQIVIKCE